MGAGGAGCLLAVGVKFYTAFVVQNLWNWFVAEAVHGAEISYWRAVGIMILLYLLRHSGRGSVDVENDQRWKELSIMMEASVPPNNAQEVRFALKKLKSETLTSNTITFAEALIATVALGVGWVVHSFLVG